ncbi:hypothetical protein M569_06384 [Genlisea aurea]|uniref:Uncharacterized protein n=1 Tax=Genlisea aurea TaxID=192259 RepID=S8CNW0_9LAMI|nr:hypothetical protein M569_06384 [Genlisea aurea]
MLKVFHVGFFLNLSGLRFGCCFSTCSLAVRETSDFHTRYRILRGKVQIHASSSNLSEALKILNEMKESIPGRPTASDYNYMMMCYFKSRNAALDDLHEVYLRMRSSGPMPNFFTYQILLNGAMSERSGFGSKYAVLVLSEMLRRGFVPSYTSLSRLLKLLLLRAESISDAILVFDAMSDAGFVPCGSSVSVLIKSLCRNGMIRKAFSFFSALSARGCCCRDSFYNPILWSLSKSDQLPAALAFFAVLEKKGFKHSVYTYTALVYGLGRGKSWDRVFRMLDISEKSVETRPSLITYTVVVKLLCEDAKVDLAIDVLRRMERNGCEPDLVAYNVVIRELSRQGRLDEVGDFIRGIDERGLVPDRYTHASVCGGLIETGRFDLAKSLSFRSIVSRGCSVDDAVCNIYLHSLCCSGGSKEALSTMERMAAEGGFRPSAVSYNTIVKGFCSENNIEEALRVLDGCDDGTETKPDSFSFNAVLSAAGKLADSAAIRRILTRMQRGSIGFDVVGATCMARYYFAVGNVSECLKLVDSMVAYGPHPNSVTLNTVLAGLCRIRQLGLAMQIFDRLKAAGVPPNAASYAILMRAAVRDEDVRLLDQLFGEMRSRGIEADVRVYGCFVYGLCRKGKLSAALDLRDRLRENGVSPDVSIYNALLEAMVARRTFGDVVGLLKRMAIDGCLPNEGSYRILRRARKNGWRSRRDFHRGVKLVQFLMFGHVSSETLNHKS